MGRIVFIDAEITLDEKIADVAAFESDLLEYHGANLNSFKQFCKNYDFYVGHNIVDHDMKYLGKHLPFYSTIVDTLYVSPLLFPKKPYHSLTKDEKLVDGELNNPLNDCKKCLKLFYDEINAFKKLDSSLKSIYTTLLSSDIHFYGFFKYVKGNKTVFIKKEITTRFKNQICDNADLSDFINNHPIELAYALAIITVDDSLNGKQSLTPAWVLRQYPYVETIIAKLKGTSCDNCDYCKSKLDARKRLKDFFGFDSFRLFNGEPLQENAVNAALKKKSLIAIFPTGGGKSLTFQLPALINGETEKALTIVISPLQSLMKDQVDKLEEKGITDAVYINGLLDPITRKEHLERIENGIASILYIAPESLRSRTIEKIISGRTIARFVIDEAHCFSTWGQDFRPDYQYIGTFIEKIKSLKNTSYIPVSCFTATAKQKVISDIVDYFRQINNISLDIYSTDSTRDNLRYKVIKEDNDQEKYLELRNLILDKNVPTIVFCSSVHDTRKIAEKLNKDGIIALPYNGQMDSEEKKNNQDKFVNNECQVMVATNAFGMGVDKDNVGLVIHYDISSSLENYVQESGRAGRDINLTADCYILYNEEDLNNHFMLLNRSKLTLDDIQRVLSAIKSLSKNRSTIVCSALELAREAGWDESIQDIETRVRAAINVLENTGYIRRGLNVPRVFANSIQAKTFTEADEKLVKSSLFEGKEYELAKRILNCLISERSIAKAGNGDAESRVDYIADMLGVLKEDVVHIINLMKQANVLSDDSDMSANFVKGYSDSYYLTVLRRFLSIERMMIDMLPFNVERSILNLKELNEIISDKEKRCNIKDIKSIYLYWIINEFVEKKNSSTDNIEFVPLMNKENIIEEFEKRSELSSFIVEYLISKKKEDTIEFSIVELLRAFNSRLTLLKVDVNLKDVEKALLYLSKIKLLSLEGGFLVFYNGMQIEKLVSNNVRYKNEDYKQLKEYYNLKVQQIHIVGEYANMMLKDYNEALTFVHDYFNLQYEGFIKKYFIGGKYGQIQKNITPEKYDKLFGNLSNIQKDVIDDDKNQYIEVIAGPGSGKTRLLVHKLASLLYLEDVKPEQLLMLTFSRAAATEFKSRLIELVGNAAYFVEIKTFHSYCFDILGRIGKEEEFDDVIPSAIELIKSGDAESLKIHKSVLVIDEAQDMSNNDFELIKTLISQNEDMRVIIVGDDDQNIYEFRDSNSKYLKEFENLYNAKKYEMLHNYRSVNRIVQFINGFEKTIKQRYKDNELYSVRNDLGKVEIIEHASANMEEAILNHIKKNNEKDKHIAILTLTNEDAYRMLGTLLINNYNATLIQSNDSYNLYNLRELRALINLIDQNSEPVISKEIFDESLEKVKNVFKKSTIIPIIEKMVLTYEKNNNIYYKSDFIEYICESKLEDFEDFESKKIIISTIHMSKGHEFDTVYLMLNNLRLVSDEEKRRLYVGASRAKNNLYIHINRDSLKYYSEKESLKKYVSYYFDEKEYNEPGEMYVSTSHRSVKLSDFSYRTYTMDRLYSGSSLIYRDFSLYTTEKTEHRVARFSDAFKDKISTLLDKGYEIIDTKVEQLVYWKPKDEPDKEECLIPIMLIHLKRNEAVQPTVKIENTQNDDYESNEIEEPEQVFKEEANDGASKETDFVDTLDKKQKSLVIELKKYRMNKANEENIPIAYVFSNKTLYSIIEKLPISKKEFSYVDGIGAKKTDRYGNDIAEICKIFVDKNPSYKTWSPDSNDKFATNEKISESHNASNLPEKDSLFNELKKFRSIVAKVTNVPHYSIFLNNELQAIVDAVPHSIDELKAIDGLRKSTIEIYGSKIINICMKYKK